MGPDLFDDCSLIGRCLFMRMHMDIMTTQNCLRLPAF
jgi:hypothetical protein